MPLSDLAHRVNGTLRATDETAVVTSIATDSREVTSGTLFLGIRGERVDGNLYAASALERGASAVLCERIPESGNAVSVEDTVLALGRLAASVKAEIAPKTVAVTGSVGKTTTKDLIHAVLSQHFRTHCSAGNYNSNIGLPMSILAMPKESEIGVFELGMSARGEIDYLTRLLTPDIGVITNIGVAHLESLGSRENIFRAKMELLNGMKPGSTLILNGDDPYLREGGEMAESLGINVHYVSVRPSGSVSFYADRIRSEIGSTTFDLVTRNGVYRDMKLYAMGIHTVSAALLAAAVGILSGCTEEEIREGFLSFRSAPLRQSIEERGGVTLIEDCYNASPDSVRAAIDVMRTIAQKREGSRMIALLGDMRELGETTGALHSEVGKYVAEAGVARLFTMGEIASQYLASGAEKGGIPHECICACDCEEQFEHLADEIRSTLRAGDILLVKASRALRAERVLDQIRATL